MSEIARRLTGFSKGDFFNYELPSSASKNDFFYPRGVNVRQSVRAFTGKIVGSEDLNAKRQELLENVPETLKKK